MEVLLGSIQLFPYNFAPKGFYICDGQLLSIAQYTALFSLIGTMYGGNGTTDFALPNLKAQTPEGMMYCIAFEGIYPSRP